MENTYCNINSYHFIVAVLKGKGLKATSAKKTVLWHKLVLKM